MLKKLKDMKLAMEMNTRIISHSWGTSSIDTEYLSYVMTVPTRVVAF
jgi:hypothetical protein